MRARLAVLTLLPLLLAPVARPDAAASPLAPELHDLRLRNGLRLLVVEQPRLPLFSMQLWVQAGSAHERDDESGAAALVAELLAPGGKRFGREGVERWVQEAGGRDRVELHHEATVFALELSSDRLGDAFAITADRLRSPRFDAEALARARQRAQQRELQQGDPAMQLAEQRLHAAAFLVEGLRRPLRGWPGSLAQRSLDDCQRFFERRYRPDAMVLVVVGDVQLARVQSLARKHLEPLRGRRGEAPVPPSEPEPSGERRLLEAVPGSLDVLAVGYRLPAMDHRDSAALEVLSALLDGDGRGPLARIAGRDGAVAESATADLLQGRRAGLYEVRLALAPGQDAWAAEQRLLQTLDRAIDKLDAEQVAQARQQRLALHHQEHLRVDGLAGCLGRSAVLSGDPLRARARLEALQAVDAPGLRAVATRYLRPERRTVVHLSSQPGPPPARPGGEEARP